MVAGPHGQLRLRIVSIASAYFCGSPWQAKQECRSDGDDSWSPVGTAETHPAHHARHRGCLCVSQRPRRGCAARAAAAAGGAPRARKPDPRETAAPLRRPRRRAPISTVCRRTRQPSRPSICPAGRSPLRQRRVRSACSTTRANRRPTSPTPPTSWTGPIARRVPSPLSSMADRARRRPGCNSAITGPGGLPSTPMR